MEYGTIRIKLDELLKDSGLSKNMLSPSGRDAADTDQQLLQESNYSIGYRCSRSTMYGIEL